MKTIVTFKILGSPGELIQVLWICFEKLVLCTSEEVPENLPLLFATAHSSRGVGPQTSLGETLFLQPTSFVSPGPAANSLLGQKLYFTSGLPPKCSLG